ncbi:hypothetical protein MGN70_008766 [Eutypa lata]|nr:hypothetical protein MGN70_008766 [Eutypa lata]
MGNTSSSTRSIATTLTPSFTSSWSIPTHGPPITSIPLSTAASTYTSVIPIYTTNSIVEEVCHHGIGDDATETCLTTTKTVTDLVSFRESIIRQSASRPSHSWPSHTSVVSSVPWCPDYPFCSSSRSTHTRPSFTFSRSTHSRTTRSLSTRRSSTSYAVTSTLWDNSSTLFPWLTTGGLTPSPDWSETLSIETTSPDPESESCTDILCILTSLEGDTSTSTSTSSSSSSSSRSRSRTRTRTRSTSSHTRLHTYTHLPDPTTTSDDDDATAFTDPFPGPTTSTDSDECDVFDWWWCTTMESTWSTSSTSSSSSSSSHSHHHRPSHSLSRSSSCLWWDFYCSEAESPPFSTEVPEISLPCETSTSSSSTSRITLSIPSTITWVPESFSDTYLSQFSTSSTQGPDTSTDTYWSEFSTISEEEPYYDDEGEDEDEDDGGLFSHN